MIETKYLVFEETIDLMCPEHGHGISASVASNKLIDVPCIHIDCMSRAGSVWPSENTEYPTE